MQRLTRTIGKRLLILLFLTIVAILVLLIWRHWDLIVEIWKHLFQYYQD